MSSSRKDKIFEILKDKNWIEKKDEKKMIGLKRKQEDTNDSVAYRTTADMLQLFDNGSWDEFNWRVEEGFQAIKIHKKKKIDCSLTEHSLKTVEKENRLNDQIQTNHETVMDSKYMLKLDDQTQTNHELVTDPKYKPKLNDQTQTHYEMVMDPKCKPTSMDIRSPEANHIDCSLTEHSLKTVEKENRLNDQTRTNHEVVMDPKYKPLSMDICSPEANNICILEMTLEELQGTPVDALHTLLDDSQNSTTLRPEQCSSKKQLFEDANTIEEDKVKSRKSRMHNCLYCDTLVTNFRRHVFRKHALEEEVRAVLMENDEDLRERKKKRRFLLNNLRKKGNYKYNSSRQAYGEDPVLPIRRPSSNQDTYAIGKYVSCIFCLGAFSRKTFYRHLKKCENNPKNDGSVSGEDTPTTSVRKAVLKSSTLNLIPSISGHDNLKSTVIDVIQKDKFGIIAINDYLIMEIGAQYLSNHKEKKDEYNLTKKMRDAAKLLDYCQQNSEKGTITELSNLIHPSKFQLVIKAVQHLSKLNVETGEVTVVGMPARLSYVILEGAKIIYNNAIQNNCISRSEKEEIKTYIHEFIELFKNSYKYYISTNAEKSRKKRSATKEEVMPADEDIATVMNMVKKQLTTLYEKLNKEVNASTYESLCKAVICELLLFNRRRPGELVRAELFNYCNRPKNDALTEDVLAVLSEEEKKSLSRFSVFMVPGKNVRTVPILFTEVIKNCLDLLITSRSTLKIPIENRLLFPRVLSNKPFDGSKILKEFASMCTLKKPQHLTATGLRHHLATKTSLAGKESLTENVCEQLGHSLAVHKQNYRYPIQAIQRGVVANHLSNVNGIKGAMQSTSTVTSVDQLESHTSEDQNKVCENEDSEWPGHLYLENHVSSSDEEEVLEHKPRKHKKWTEEGKILVIQTFSSFIKSKTTPGKIKCEELIRNNPILRGRTWQQVNAVVHNVITKKMKIPLGIKCMGLF